MAGASSHTPQGCGFDPLSGCWGRQPMDVSFLISMFLPLSLSLSLFLSKLIKVSSGEDKKKPLVDSLQRNSNITVFEKAQCSMTNVL